MCYGIAIIGIELPCEGVCTKIGVELALSELELDLKICKTEFTRALAVHSYSHIPNSSIGRNNSLGWKTTNI